MAPPSRSATDEQPQVLWTPETYHAAHDAGWFDGRRVELLRGKVYDKMTMNRPHKLALRRMRRAIDQALADVPHVVDNQAPIYLPDSEPEPDFAIVGSDDIDASNDAPVLLIVEIAESSLATDRSIKLELYAATGYLEYWIINLRDRQLEVHRQPEVINGVGRYAEVTMLREGESVTPLAGGTAIAVADVLPPTE
jgi:Uma2 family endonuclease